MIAARHTLPSPALPLFTPRCAPISLPSVLKTPRRASTQRPPRRTPNSFRFFPQAAKMAHTRIAATPFPSCVYSQISVPPLGYPYAPAPRHFCRQDFRAISFPFTLFRTLLLLAKTYLPPFQAIPNSFTKTPGVWVHLCLPHSQLFFVTSSLRYLITSRLQSATLRCVGTFDDR